MPNATKSDAAKPKGKMSAYSYFVQICREQLKKDYPDEPIAFAEFNKSCGKRWKSMTDEEKERFIALAEKDKERYDAELKEYGPSKAKKRKQVKDPNAPKKALSAFFWFCNAERAKVKESHPEYSVSDVAKELGRMWSEADPALKKEFEELSNQDKERYQKELVEYKNKITQSTAENTNGQNGEHNESTSD